VTALQILASLSEQQLSDATRLKRVVANFQRELGATFGNAMVKRRQRRWEIDLAVYEKPLTGTKTYRMPARQIQDWVRQAANRAHPRLYKRLKMEVGAWEMGKRTQKLFAPVKIFIDASQD